MSKLIIDAGGTSLKYQLINNDYKIVDEGTLIGGNLSNDFDEVLENVKKLLNKYPEVSSGIFAFAGFEGIPEAKKQELRSLFNEIKNKLIISDALLPTYITDKKVISLTLGTGSAIFRRNGNNFKQYLGFGYAIGDIGSGFEIGRNILLEVLLTENNDYITEAKKILGTEDEIIKFIWSDKSRIQKRIASITALLNSNNSELSDLSNRIFDRELNKYLDYIKTIIHDDEVIVLNGGIFNNNQKAIDIIKSTFSKNEIIVIKENPLGIALNILKDKKW